MSSPTPVPTSDSLWKVYSAINEWIRFADTKAGAILAVNGVLAGLAATLIKDNRKELIASIPLAVTVVLGLAALAVSAVYCINCISPSLGFLRPNKLVPSPVANLDPKTSLIFFDHIAAIPSAADYAPFASAAFSEENKLQDQLSQQVWANARVCRDKNKQVAWAILLLSIALVFGALSIVIGFFVSGVTNGG